MTKFAKRTVDLCAAILGFILLSPLLGLVALVVRLAMGRPVLFRQRRIGSHGKPFQLYKFRTMSDARDGNGRLLSDEERLGPVGKIVRAASLDELPQLWNVVRGDMSLVGPRPLLPEYLPRYNPRQLRRHETKPGITGWAQINGRNTLTWEEKFELDVWYVDHRTLWLDVRILWLTVLKVLQRDGISRQGHATMPEFTGGHNE
jgi:sugar transferase EpsL